MSLEPWQRYRKATPCPICHGYGAYKPENRCKGFRAANELGVWCSQTPSDSSAYFEALGLDLFFHSYSQEQGEGEVKQPRLRYKRSLWIEKGRLRRQAREAESRRPPTVRDFG